MYKSDIFQNYWSARSASPICLISSFWPFGFVIWLILHCRMLDKNGVDPDMWLVAPESSIQFCVVDSWDVYAIKLFEFDAILWALLVIAATSSVSLRIFPWTNSFLFMSPISRKKFIAFPDSICNCIRRCRSLFASCTWGREVSLSGMKSQFSFAIRFFENKLIVSALRLNSIIACVWRWLLFRLHSQELLSRSRTILWLLAGANKLLVPSNDSCWSEAFRVRLEEINSLFMFG